MTDQQRRFLTVKMAAEDLGTSPGVVYRWLRETTTEQVSRETHRLPVGHRFVPKLVVDVLALGRYRDGITNGRPRKS